MTTARIASGLALLLACGACGRNLALEPRLTLATGDIQQFYQVAVFETGSGPTGYTATAVFATDQGGDPVPTALPVGDVVTLAGTALTASPAGVFTVTGTGNPGTFPFAWTHAGTTYENTVTATGYPPAADPETVSVASPSAIQVLGVASGVAVSATVNAGPAVAQPFFSLPVDVTGAGTAAAVTATLTGLATGPGVVILLESGTAALQDGTTAGGGLNTTIQYGYNVTITP